MFDPFRSDVKLNMQILLASYTPPNVTKISPLANLSVPPNVSVADTAKLQDLVSSINKRL